MRVGELRGMVVPAPSLTMGKAESLDTGRGVQKETVGLQFCARVTAPTITVSSCP